MGAHGNQENNANIHVLPKDKEKISKIWKTAGILALVTAIEFVLAFTLPRGFVLTSLFVLLTFVKTFYIVGEFMHLKYEVKTLIWSIIIPTLFIMWLILALMMEGGSVFNLRQWILIR